MSGFVNPLEKYPLPATPRNTRSAASSSRSPTTTKDSRTAAALTMNSRKSAQAASTPRQTKSRRRVTRSSSRDVDDDQHTALRGGKDKKGRTDLAPVGEAEEDDNGGDEVLSNAADQQLNEELEHEVEPLHDHDVSGETLLPTASDDESGEVDAISIAESLPLLQGAASKLLDFFASGFSSPSRIAELARQLSNPKSSQSKKLNFLSNHFSSQKEHFGNETYISAEKIAAIIPSVEFSSKTWRVDGIIYKSNCAQLALEILTKISMTGGLQESMYALEDNFPLPFLKSFESGDVVHSAGKSGLRRGTIDLALGIRTQFFKLRLLLERPENGHDSYAILDGLFFNDDLDSQPAAESSHSLRGFNLPGILQDETGNLPERYVDDVQERVREIRACIKGQAQADFDALEERFPWEDFIFNVGKWVRSRNEELNNHLQQQPSVEEIHEKLEEIITQSNPDDIDAAQEGETGEEAAPATHEEQNNQRRRLLPAPEIREKRAPGGRKSYSDMKSLIAFARMEKQYNSDAFAPRLSKLTSNPTGRTSVPVTPASRLAQQMSASPAQALDAGDFDRRGSLQPSRRPVAANQRHSLPSHALQGRSYQQRQGPAFIDPQAHASRVSPIDSQRFGSGPSSSRKRTRDEDEDEDGEFERDSRPIDVQQRRGQKPAQATKRARYDNGHVNDVSNGFTPSPAHQHQGSDALVQRADATPIPRPVPMSTPQKPTQTRRPWTKEEDSRFIQLIEEHGTSWAEIKSKDEVSESPKLTKRDQGNLKDRARNLVMIMLKGGTPYEQLPVNFNRIPLKKIDVENLRKRGIKIPDPLAPRQSNYF